MTDILALQAHREQAEREAWAKEEAERARNRLAWQVVQLLDEYVHHPEEKAMVTMARWERLLESLERAKNA